MAEKIKIDVVSDVVCPWCIIGYKRLQQAIDELEINNVVELEWQPFELNRNMEADGQELLEHLTEKYGSSFDQIKQSQKHLTDLGAELGFQFNFKEGMRIVNTRAAHVLLNWALKEGKQTDLNIRLVKAYFTEGKDISNHTVLMEEVHTLELNPDEAQAILYDHEEIEQIVNKENYWQQMGVRSVPTVVFDGKSALTGAQTIDIYKKVLSEILNETE